MTGRERFQNLMHYRPVDRAPSIEVGCWPECVPLWRAQGMPENTGVTEKSILTFDGNPFFGLDRQLNLSLSLGMMPGFRWRVLEEDERTTTVRNSNGVTVRTLKNSTNMPQYLGWPVRDRGDFEKMKKRYNPKTPKRYPENWAEIARESQNSECPVWGPRIGSVGIFSMIRTWMGTENACTVFYDDPALAHDMCEFIADFAVEAMQRALTEAKMDYFMWWEDFSFKTGPLVSPSIFKEFMLARYRRANDALRKAGIDIIFLDTDGDPRVLYKLLLDAGVNGAYPLEQCCPEMSPVALRKRFGRDLLLWGGLDKRELAKDRAAIDRELESKLPPLLADGGYIPELDHLAPPDISYANWLYFLERKKRLLESRADAS